MFMWDNIVSLAKSNRIVDENEDQAINVYYRGTKGDQEWILVGHHK